jgi:MoaA/NifB/PqqE/SkfB family radical SAM enzyme
MRSRHSTDLTANVCENALIASFWKHRDEKGLRRDRSVLRGPFRPFGMHGWIAPVSTLGDDQGNSFRSELCLFEDGRRMSHGHIRHWVIGALGQGRYSHWERRLFFSTPDGSDPNSNGRVYSFDFSLDEATWKRERMERSARRWHWHPRGEYFVQRGGDLVPPPLACNIGLTNKCNLRCEICGSQKHLDQSGGRRRHMPLKTFEAVAETMFPFLSVVELNSQGDPLLHPNIADVLGRIAEHGCDIKVQHNGTLLAASIVNLLCRQHGTIMLSLDAIGAKFDEVRQGGVWAKAVPGLHALLAERDPARLSVGVYPTLTRRTIGEAINVLNWSAEHGVDVVAFHRYAPILGSFEEAPAENDYETLKDDLTRWCARNGDSVKVQFESECLNRKEPTSRRQEFASLEKAVAAAESWFVTFPTEDDNPNADPALTCTAPRDYVEIGLEGQISVCCRSQDVPLGYATSIEAFSNTWFGQNFNRIRHSLTRGATAAYPLPNCEGCMKYFAPKAASNRRSMDYESSDAQSGLVIPITNGILFEEIRRESGHCNIAPIPPGLDIFALELWEDDRQLGPGNTLHEEIRTLGGGRYHIGARSVYFSSSDGTDAQRNQRTYALRLR